MYTTGACCIIFPERQLSGTIGNDKTKLGSDEGVCGTTSSDQCFRHEHDKQGDQQPKPLGPNHGPRWWLTSHDSCSSKDVLFNLLLALQREDEGQQRYSQSRHFTCNSKCAMKMAKESNTGNTTSNCCDCNICRQRRC
mmetsp:Transcript_58886/g.131479  ORF Transcript_58886/g.131479 Transcript_58886/m.131479 type:complete len:138 (-) Transcript_58886:125-538(-)